MKSMQEIKADSAKIVEICKQYSGANGCHICVIAQDDGKHNVSFGGRVDIAGEYISEILARIVMTTPMLEDDFIDAVANCAKDMVRHLQKVVPLHPQ